MYVFTSRVCEKGETEVSKQSLEMGIFMKPRTVPETFDPSKLGHLIERIRLRKQCTFYKITQCHAYANTRIKLPLRKPYARYTVYTAICKNDV